MTMFTTNVLTAANGVALGAVVDDAGKNVCYHVIRNYGLKGKRIDIFDYKVAADMQYANLVLEASN